MPVTNTQLVGVSVKVMHDNDDYLKNIHDALKHILRWTECTCMSSGVGAAFHGFDPPDISFTILCWDTRDNFKTKRVLIIGTSYSYK
jgi:NAD(P)H-dependent FMN reductase